MNKQKTISIISFLFLCFVLGVGYNKNGALAQTDVVPIVCEQSALVSSEGILRNKLEIPVGRTTDYAQYLADEISKELAIMINQANIEITASKTLTELVNSCSDDDCESRCEQKCGGCSTKRCENREESPNICNQECQNCPSDKLCCCEVDRTTGGYAIGCKGCDYVGCDSSKWTNPSLCKEAYRSRRSDELLCCSIKCEPQPCEGEACSAEIQTNMNIINSAVEIMAVSRQKIFDYYWLEMEVGVKKGVRTSRDRFAGCATRPDEAAKLFEGEAIGKQLFDCRTVLDSFIPVNTVYPKKTIPDQSCYGNTYCQYLDDGGQKLPYPGEACAEDYFCCYLGQ